MPQTILAVLAMMIASVFVLQAQRSSIEIEMEMIRNDIELQSTGVAEDVLGEIGAAAFDESTKDASVTSSTSLTSEADFETADGGSDDIDDFHGCCSTNRLRTGTSDTLRFSVEVAVTYADPSNIDQPVDTRTKVKKATVRVTNQDLARAKTIVLSRSFTCGSKCAW